MIDNMKVGNLYLKTLVDNNDYNDIIDLSEAIPKCFDNLADAVKEGEKRTAKYPRSIFALFEIKELDNQKGTMVLDPLSLFFSGGVWGWIHK